MCLSKLEFSKKRIWPTCVCVVFFFCFFFFTDVHLVGIVVLLQESGSTNLESYLFCVLPVAMYHPICLLALNIFISHLLLSSTFCLPALLFYICYWNEFVPSVHVLHLLHNIVFSYEIPTIWIISIAEYSACYLNSSEAEYNILYISTLAVLNAWVLNLPSNETLYNGQVCFVKGAFYW
jgi:hypothetical protein